MATPEERERESRESEETKFDDAVERESERREELGRRVADEPLPDEADEE